MRLPDGLGVVHANRARLTRKIERHSSNRLDQALDSADDCRIVTALDGLGQPYSLTFDGAPMLLW